jgi:hypothetical protein
MVKLFIVFRLALPHPNPVVFGLLIKEGSASSKITHSINMPHTPADTQLLTSILTPCLTFPPETRKRLEPNTREKEVM